MSNKAVTRFSVKKTIRIKKEHLEFIYNDFIPMNKGKYGNLNAVVNKFLGMVINEIKRQRQ